MTPAQLLALKAELTTDPSGLGYTVPLTGGQDWKLAEILNTRRAITLKRADISAAEILQAVDYADLILPVAPGSPTPQELRLERLAICFLSGLAALGTVRLQNEDNTFTAIGLNLNTIIRTGTATRTRIVSLATRTQCSRCEQLFGIGFLVSVDDVSMAKALP